MMLLFVMSFVYRDCIRFAAEAARSTLYRCTGIMADVLKYAVNNPQILIEAAR